MEFGAVAAVVSLAPLTFLLHLAASARVPVLVSAFRMDEGLFSELMLRIDPPLWLLSDTDDASLCNRCRVYFCSQGLGPDQAGLAVDMFLEFAARRRPRKAASEPVSGCIESSRQTDAVKGIEECEKSTRQSAEQRRAEQAILDPRVIPTVDTPVFPSIARPQRRGVSPHRLVQVPPASDVNMRVLQEAVQESLHGHVSRSPNEQLIADQELYKSVVQLRQRALAGMGQVVQLRQPSDVQLRQPSDSQ